MVSTTAQPWATQGAYIAIVSAGDGPVFPLETEALDALCYDCARICILGGAPWLKSE